MTHPREDLTALLDGALSPARAAEVEEHVADCPACREELSRLRGAVAALRALAPAPELPPAFAARLEARLRTERERRRGIRALLDTFAPAPPRGRLLAWAGGAAALVLAVGLPAGLWFRARADTRAMIAELDLLQDWEAASAVAVDSPEDALVVAQLDELLRGEATP